MSTINTELKTRRNRLSAYTPADRRLNKTVVTDDAMAIRHAAPGLGHKSFARKASK